MGGTDVNLAISGSSSATSGSRVDQRIGDIIAGGAKQTPSWVWLALAGMVLIGATVWIVRR
jgi:hypothetical protein